MGISMTLIYDVFVQLVLKQQEQEMVSVCFC